MEKYLTTISEDVVTFVNHRRNLLIYLPKVLDADNTYLTSHFTISWIGVESTKEDVTVYYECYCCKYETTSSYIKIICEEKVPATLRFKNSINQRIKHVRLHTKHPNIDWHYLCSLKRLTINHELPELTLEERAIIYAKVKILELCHLKDTELNIDIDNVKKLMFKSVNFCNKNSVFVFNENVEEVHIIDT